MTNDIADAPTYACAECGVPVVLTELVPFKKTHICRRCWEKYHPETSGVVTKDMLRKLLGDEKPVIKNGGRRLA